MKIVAFNGCKEPYTKNGIRITPIAKNPSDEEIKKTVDIASTSKVLGTGLNGRAFLWGEDLVVKKYTKQEGAKREIAVLDGMYDRGIIIPRLQQGLFAFTMPNNDTYLVSTRIKGENPNITENKFNPENLSSLMEVISEFDKPRLVNERINEVDYPYQLPLHFDLHDGNINITKTEGGIFDLEYLQYDDMSRRIDASNHNMTGCDCNLSDIPCMCSNLRSFESRALVPYLLSVDEKEADRVFDDYMKLKSEYHKKRSEFFKEESRKFKHINPKTAKINEDLAKRETAHCKMLTRPSKEVISAEKIKMQISSFIFIQSFFEGLTSARFNKDQIEQYVKDTDKFFKTMEEKSKTQDERIYWQDCNDLMKSWDGVIGWMNWQNTEPTPQMLGWFNMPKTKMTEEQIKGMHNTLEAHRANHKLFMTKKTDELLPVIAEVPKV